MEHKTFHVFETKILDEEQGIVESIVAVMGNVDEGKDIIHPGSFKKTIAERGRKVRVLDQHQIGSLMNVVGKPLEMRELSRSELPPELLAKYPDATGGLWTKTQFLMNTPEGRGVFERIKSEAVDEWSIGYDTLDKDYSKAKDKDGSDITVRNLRTLKLWEYSPVIWGMNPATLNLSAKAAEPTEGKPWRAVHEGEVWRVYKLDADGEPTGDPLGEHETEEEADEQVRALYANEGKTIYFPMERKQDMNGGDSVMVAFYPPKEIVDMLSGSVSGIDGALSSNDIHLTLCYLGNTVSDNLDKSEILSKIGSFIEYAASEKITGNINGYARFENNEEHALVAIYDSQELAEFRIGIAKFLGNTVYSNHGFVPHLTLAYLKPESDTPTIKVPKVKITFDTLYLVWGDERIPFSLNKNDRLMGMHAMMSSDPVNVKDKKAGRRMRRDKAEILSKLEGLLTELRAWADYEDEEMEDEDHMQEPAPAKAADLEPTTDKAGPAMPPTSNELVRLIEIEQEQLKLLEV